MDRAVEFAIQVEELVEKRLLARCESHEDTTFPCPTRGSKGVSDEPLRRGGKCAKYLSTCSPQSTSYGAQRRPAGGPVLNECPLRQWRSPRTPDIPKKPKTGSHCTIRAALCQQSTCSPAAPKVPRTGHKGDRRAKKYRVSSV